jgi:hypothetical protein
MLLPSSAELRIEKEKIPDSFNRNKIFSAGI